MIALIVNGELGLFVRAKLNALIGDAIKKNGTDPGQFMSGNFVLNPSLPTRIYTDDGTIKNGLLWYGTAASSFVSEGPNEYSAFIIDQAAFAHMQVKNYTTGNTASLDMAEDSLQVVGTASNFTFDGAIDFSPNYNPLSFIQEKYAVPITGTRSSNPLTDRIEFSKADGSAISSYNSFYIGSGDDLDLDAATTGSRIYFETPTLGKRFRMNLGGSSSSWESRNSTARNSLTMNTNTAFNWLQLQSNDGTNSSSLILNAASGVDYTTDYSASSGITGNADFSPNYQPFSWVQKVFTEATYEKLANKGLANGYAPLDGTSKIAGMYLPSYVDDVLEYADFSSLPATGETGKIYITLSNNNQYRWTGSVYVQITNSSAVWGNISGTIASQPDLMATFQPLDSDLTAIAALSGSSGLLKTNGAGSWNIDTTKYQTVFHRDVDDSSSLTGTTTETVMKSLLINGGTFSYGDAPYIRIIGSKGGSSGTVTVSLYVNTVNNITSGSPIALGFFTTGSANNVYYSFSRNLIIKSTLTQFYGSSAITDELQATTNRSQQAINWASNLYIIVTLKLASSTDTAFISYFQILK